MFSIFLLSSAVQIKKVPGKTRHDTPQHAEYSSSRETDIFRGTAYVLPARSPGR